MAYCVTNVRSVRLNGGCRSGCSRPWGVVGTRARRCVIRQSYIDVEAESMPSEGRRAPPPPPPPPPPRSPVKGLSRREAMFAITGALVGGLGVAGYYNTAYDLSEESATKFLDEILDDPELVQFMKEEVLYKEYEGLLDQGIKSAEELGSPQVRDQLDKLAKMIEAAENDPTPYIPDDE